MKQLLLFSLFILFSISIYSQQGPPPPCGIGYVLERCDADGDGFTQFKLTDANEYLFCNRAETDYETPKFYTDEAQTNQIASYENYVNTINPQTIYATAVNIDSGETVILNQFDIEAKMLTYTVTRLNSCSNSNNGSAFFDLTSAISFCGANNPNDYSIAYYVSQDDANNRVNQIANPSNYNSSSGTIYMVIENSNTGDFQHNSFSLVVSSVSINSPTDMLICDDVTNDGIEIFDLSQKINEISQGISESLDISFYGSQSDASIGVNPIAPISYTNIANPQTIYVRASNSLTGCFVLDSFNLNVVPTPNINQPTPLEVCDSDTSPDGFTVVDLSQKVSEIIGGGQINSIISYHYSQADADTGINAIQQPYINTNTPTDIVYVRVSNFSTGCYRTTTLSINITTSPIINKDTQYIDACDADHDGNANFDLTQVLNNILGGLTGVTTTFHENLNDANSGTNAITDASNYQYTNAIGEPGSKTIYVRVAANSTGCASIVPIEIHTNLLLTGIDSGDFALCDTNSDENDTMDFNLNTVENFIINDLPGNITITFFETEADRDSDTNPIDKSLLYAAINPTTLHIRIDDGNCSELSDITLLVNPVILFTPVEPIPYCDTDDDGIASIDLHSLDDLITKGNANFEVTYFSTQVDANNNTNQLPPFYTNINPTETIYARIENFDYGCATVNTFDLVVKDCSDLGIININAFYDADSNAIFDNDEINFLNGTLTYEKNNDGIQRVLYSSNGIFNIISDDNNNTYDISYDVWAEYDSCYNITTTSFENVQVDVGNIANYNFPITKVQDCGDIAVYLVSYVPPRPGFDYVNYLVIKNKGLETVASGSVEFVHDPLLTFNNVNNIASGNTVTNTATGFTLDFVNLAPNQQETVLINMNVPVPTSLGTLLTNTATYSVIDLSIENNTSALSEIVIGSYDPNDIAESHGPEILHSDFETTDYLYYTVRFQNVGTADAINVSIDNTLDSRLDKSTIQMLSSSHTNIFTRVDGQLNWKFDNIHLPSEDMDEPNSHGYVYYKIKPLAGYSVGDIIPNTAEIYFDFNPAVVTNTFQTEFVTTLSDEKISDSEFVLFPNPANNLVELKFNKYSSNSIKTRIYNIQGKMILNTKNQLQNKAAQLNVSSLKSGLYFLKVNDGVNEFTRKLIVK